MYAFFSSDAHDLFKKGMLDTISYPNSFCEHFRYSITNLPQEIATTPSNLVGQDGIVIYVKGNNLQLPEAQRNLSYLPLRRVKIKSTKVERNTDRIHFFLELGDFITSANLQLGNDRPTARFVGSLPNQVFDPAQWYEKVDQLLTFDPSFREIMFFNFRIETFDGKLNKRIDPTFSANESASYFSIAEDKQYVLDVGIYNTSASPVNFKDHSLAIKCNCDDLVFSNVDRITIGTDKDNRVIRFGSKILKTMKSSGSVTIKSIAQQNGKDVVDYEVDIRVDPEKTVRSIAWYSLLASLAIIAAFLIAYSIERLGHSEVPWLAMISAVLLSIASSGGLFYFFNKN